MKLWKKIWSTSRGRLIVISIVAFLIYMVSSAVVNNCIINDSCHFSNQQRTKVDTKQSTTEKLNNVDDIEDKKPQSSNVGDKQSLNNSSDSMSESYLANVYDTSIFFIIVTLAIAVFGFVRPEDEVFERKLVYLFPDLHKSEVGKKYVSNKINKMAAISPFSRHTFSFDEYIPLSDGCFLFKCGAIYEAEISNLHGNYSYKDDSVKISFELDQIEIDEIKQATGDFKWGQVTMLRTHFDNNASDPMPWHNGKNRNLTNKVHSYQIKELIIPAQESINIDVHSWTWSKFGKEKYDYLSVQRFTEVIELFFINNLPDKKLKISWKVANKCDDFDNMSDSYEKLELEPYGGKGCRKKVSVEYFTPDQLIVWKVDITEPDISQISERELEKEVS